MSELEPGRRTNRDLIVHAFQQLRFGGVGDEPGQIEEFQERREDGLRVADYLDARGVSLQSQSEQEEPRFYTDIRPSGFGNYLQTQVVLIDSSVDSSEQVIRQKIIGGGPFSDWRVEHRVRRFDKMARRLNRAPKT